MKKLSDGLKNLAACVPRAVAGNTAQVSKWEEEV